MKAILIDPYDRSIIGILTDGSLEEIYEIIGCRYVEAAYPFGAREPLFVGDESALRDPPLPQFLVPGWGYPLFGRGVIVGVDAEGDPASTKLTTEQVRKVVVFAG